MYQSFTCCTFTNTINVLFEIESSCLGLHLNVEHSLRINRNIICISYNTCILTEL